MTGKQRRYLRALGHHLKTVVQVGHEGVSDALVKQAGEQLWKTDWAPLYALGPGLAIMWVVLGANLLGDGLRDRLDPRQRGRS